MEELDCVCLHLGEVASVRNWSMPLHHHDHFCELIVVMAGQIETRIDGRTLVGNAGDVLLYPRRMPHAERSVGKAALHTIFMTFDERAWDVGGLPLMQHDQ